MDVLSTQRIVRMEHDQMARSLPRVSEFGSAFVTEEGEKQRFSLQWVRSILTTVLSVYGTKRHLPENTRGKESTEVGKQGEMPNYAEGVG